MKGSIQHILANYFPAQPVERAWLFGSYSRGEATRHSDIDLLVSFTPGSQISLLQYAHMMNDLQKLLEKKLIWWKKIPSSTLRQKAHNMIKS
jgi:predicted nucleotidyltransferase